MKPLGYVMKLINQMVAGIQMLCQSDIINLRRFCGFYLFYLGRVNTIWFIH